MALAAPEDREAAPQAPERADAAENTDAAEQAWGQDVLPALVDLVPDPEIGADAALSHEAVAAEQPETSPDATAAAADAPWATASALPHEEEPYLGAAEEQQDASSEERRFPRRGAGRGQRAGRGNEH